MEIRPDGPVHHLALVPGAVVRVPANTPHRIFDVIEEIRLYDVFAPPAF